MLFIMFVSVAIAIISARYAFVLIEQFNTEKLQEERKRRQEKIKYLEMQNQVKDLQVSLEHEKDEYGKLKNEVEAVKQRESAYKEEALKSKEWAEKVRAETERVKKEADLTKNSAEKKEREFAEKLQNLQKDNQNINDKLKELQARSAQIESENKTEIERLLNENQRLTAQLSESDLALKDTFTKSSQAETEFKKANEKIRALEKEKQDITAKLKEAQTSSAHLDSENKTEIERLLNENRQLTSQLSESGQTLKDAFTESSQTKAELKKFGEKLRALEKDKQDIAAKLKEAQTSSAHLDSENKTEIERLQNENQRLTAQLSESDRALKDALTQNSQADLELKKISEKLRALEKDKQDIINKLNEVQTSSIQLEPASKTGPVAADFLEESEVDTWWAESSQDSITFKKRHGITIAAQQKEKEIGEILLNKKLISKNILDRALQYQEQYGGSITQYLLAFGFIDENDLAQCLCGHFKLPYLQLSSCDIPDEIIKTVPADIAERYLAIPIDKIKDTIMVAMQNPLDSKAIEILKESTGCNVRPFVGVISEIIEALEFYYHVKPKGKKKKLPFFVESEAYTGLERRKSVRLNAQLDITFPMQGEYKKSKTIDVSRNGFCFESESPLPIGSILPLEISLPSQLSPAPVVALTKVVKISNLKNNLFAIHVATTKISKKGLSAVIEYASVKSKEAAV